MKINWKVRLKNKAFLVSLFAAILLLVQEVSKIMGYEIPVEMSQQAETIFNTVLSVLVLSGVVVDPTTEGVKDSEQVLNK